MKRFQASCLFDLISPDGYITKYTKVSEREAKATIMIADISPDFQGFQIDPSLVSFNIKSTLAQIGLDGIGIEYSLQKKKQVENPIGNWKYYVNNITISGKGILEAGFQSTFASGFAGLRADFLFHHSSFLVLADSILSASQHASISDNRVQRLIVWCV